MCPVYVPGRLGDLTLLCRTGQHPAGDLFDGQEDLSGRKLGILVCHPRQSGPQAVAEATVEVHRRLAMASGAQLARIHRLTMVGEHPVIVTEPRNPNLLKLPRHKTVSKSQARSMAHAVALGLRQAEKAGLLHMGLHPGCVLLRPDGVRLAGFSPWNVLDTPPGGQWANLYPTGWAPPEVTQGARPTLASDIWSVGALLLYMAARWVPDADECPIDVLRNLRPDLSHGFAQGVKWLMDPDPARRPESWRVVLDLLTPGAGAGHLDAASPRGSKRIPSLGPGSRISSPESRRRAQEEHNLSTMAGLSVSNLPADIGNAHDHVRSLGTDARSMLQLAADEFADMDGGSPLEIMTRKVVDEDEDSDLLGPGELN